ncbi:MAG TPA: NAD-dependent epimerase/dehydratase family protein [Chloroflexota bacterium]
MSIVLVTGGAGFIGSHVVRALAQRGEQVRVLDSLEPPVHQHAAPDLPHGVTLVRGSVTDRAALGDALQGVDRVVHLAAYQDYLPDFSHFFHTNVVGTALLYELAVAGSLPLEKIVVASSQAVYGEGRYRCARDGAQYPSQRPDQQLRDRAWEIVCPVCGQAMEPDWTPEDRVSPHNSYAMSKRAEEELTLRLGERYGIASVGLRYSIVQGPGQSFHNAYSGALRSFAVRVLNGQPPIAFEDGLQLRDYVSIHDVVAATLMALDRHDMDGQAFNVGAGRRVSVLDLARIVLEESGVEDLEVSLPGLYRVGDTRHILSDTSRLQALGWSARVDQRTMVREYLDWARAQPDLSDTFAAAEHKMRSLNVLRAAGAGM